MSISQEQYDHDHAIVKTQLEEFVEKDNSLRKLSTRSDNDYVIIYEFDVTPCCIPLNSLFWINSKIPGLFLRVFFDGPNNDTAYKKTLSTINSLNYELPTGCFVIDPNRESVVFKNGFYYEGVLLSKELMNSFLNSSFEFVSLHWKTILESVLGVENFVHNH